jgi:2-dehydro-3-deoxyphosphooctonate aldolase (KDO 8-P synthase)
VSVAEILITPDISIGGDAPTLLIAGPCVIESEKMALRHAEQIAQIADQVGIPFVFKASYDKANRTSGKSFRGPGLDEGLRILSRIKSELGIPIITDAHTVEEMAIAGEVVDIIQIPAFLCRQTDLIHAAARTTALVNVKKGQFMAPDDMRNVVDKLTEAGGQRITLTERGVSFGYNRLLVDFAGIVKMRQFGYPVIFDATHSVQMPGGQGDRSGGERHYAPYLAWAAAAVGIDGLFIETHEDPDSALSDGPNMIPIDELKPVIERFAQISNL